MFLMIGVMLGVLALSLESPQGYERAGELLTSWFGKLVVLGLIWAFSHHFIAGIRFLLLDLHVGAELAAARKSSALVLIVSLAWTILLGVLTW
jgi:succinate dehydrogenase / fumarate reductase cytochrome b subunit